MSNLLRCGLSRFSRGLFPSTSVFLFMLMHSTGLHQNFVLTHSLPLPHFVNKSRIRGVSLAYRDTNVTSL